MNVFLFATLNRNCCLEKSTVIIVLIIFFFFFVLNPYTVLYFQDFFVLFNLFSLWHQCYRVDLKECISGSYLLFSWCRFFSKNKFFVQQQSRWMLLSLCMCSCVFACILSLIWLICVLIYLVIKIILKTRFSSLLFESGIWINSNIFMQYSYFFLDLHTVHFTNQDL